MLRLPIHFLKTGNATAKFEGVPVSEQMLEMEIGDCDRCGEDAGPKGRGLVTDIRVVDGVVRGTVICVDCVLTDPLLSAYDPALEDDEDE